MSAVRLLKYLGYRQAHPVSYLFSVPRDWIKPLEDELAKQLGATLGTHSMPLDNFSCTVFELIGSGIDGCVKAYTHEDIGMSKIADPVTLYLCDSQAHFGVGIWRDR